ncbi:MULTISPECIES: pyridoxamine 5'-phosphate oxidase family protein [Streptomyces]|uniref:DNA-binding protein n=2 Tax=Streptomyces albus subsp. albus TaxID=67257 RepID=A0A0B5EH10_STRA4|nr:pyridoxamine 5'-phosphate oxidase family protein [Streptomyces sp. SCSIO ZS0520]AJE80684.1 DNA-binding protein [Streptomyces albus]AOU74995.1 DNA-binding protein [Streptomyces albus]AYN30803.1 hypothetical protein DUI70_0300 [Streptomyces albus]CCD31863.1 DNA-binding protein [Streptomyces albus subsp. albus]
MPTSRTTADPGAAGPALGRRVARRRAELGLSTEEAADRCCAAPAFLAYVEEGRAVPGPGLLLRLAEALRTTVAELSEEGAPALVDGPQPPLVEMDESECRELLAGHGLGQVAVFGSEGPDIVPVNYLLAGGEVVFRTSAGSVPAAAAGADIALEADHFDEDGKGWCVLVQGPARAVVGYDAVLRFEEQAEHLPWSGGASGLWIALSPVRMTGRKAAPAAAPPPRA